MFIYDQFLIRFFENSNNPVEMPRNIMLFLLPFKMAALVIFPPFLLITLLTDFKIISSTWLFVILYILQLHRSNFFIAKH